MTTATDNPSAYPLDPRNGPAYHTGEPCIEAGCNEPAGTAWSPYWCWRHNAERLARIGVAFAACAGAAGPPRVAGQALKLWKDASCIFVARDAAHAADLKRDQGGRYDEAEYGPFEEVTADPLTLGVPDGEDGDGNTVWVPHAAPLADWIADWLDQNGGEPGFFGVAGQIPDAEGRFGI